MSNEFTNEDFSAMAAEMENEKKTFESPYWKPANEGTYALRIITPLKKFNEKLFYEKHDMHYINNRGYYCLNQTLKDKDGNIHEAEACPICAKSKQLYSISTKDTPEWKQAGELRKKERYVSRVVVRGKKTKDGADDEAKPEFWEFGKKIHDYFFELIKNNMAGNFLALKDGRDYMLVKKGTGRNSDYSASMIAMNQSPVFPLTDKEKLTKLLENLNSMEYSQLVEFRPASELKAAVDEYFNSSKEETVSTPTPQAVNDLASDPLEQAVYGGASVAPTPASPAVPDDIDDLLNSI